MLRADQDSAGAGLAVALLVVLREAGEQEPGAAVLLSPFVDLTGSGASMTERAAQDPIFTPDMLRQLAAAYLAGAEPKSPLLRRCSPHWLGCCRCWCK